MATIWQKLSCFTNETKPENMGMKNRGKKVASPMDETDTAVQLFYVDIEV